MTTPQNPNETGRVARVRQTTTRRATGQAPAGSESRAYETVTETPDSDTTGQEAWIGTIPPTYPTATCPGVQSLRAW